MRSISHLCPVMNRQPNRLLGSAPSRRPDARHGRGCSDTILAVTRRPRRWPSNVWRHCPSKTISALVFVLVVPESRWGRMAVGDRTPIIWSRKLYGSRPGFENSSRKSASLGLSSRFSAVHWSSLGAHGPIVGQRTWRWQDWPPSPLRDGSLKGRESVCSPNQFFTNISNPVDQRWSGVLLCRPSARFSVVGLHHETWVISGVHS